jgi:RND family efflux transporter MFP subunit
MAKGEAAQQHRRSTILLRGAAFGDRERATAFEDHTRDNPEESMTKKAWLLGGGFALAALAAAAWLLRPQAQAPATAPAAAAQTVTVVRAQARDVPVTIEATGTVVSLNSVDIRPQVSSTVRQVAIKEGQFVRQGDLLFAFDDRSDRANLEKARAQLLRDRATLADLERQYRRAQELRDQNFIAQSAVDTVLANLDAQRALVASDAAAVHSSEVGLSYNQIRSPLAGRAGAIAVYPGSLVSPTGAALVTISQVDPIGVSFTVPESQLAPLLQASSGAPASVTVRVPGQASTSASGVAAGVVGQVSFIDNAVDAQSGTIRVKGQFANAQHQLWPGQFVTARMTLRTLAGATVVPQAALILGAGQQRVLYVVDEAGNAQLRPVQLRYAFGEFAVVDGVKPGERIVTDGKQNLRPGTPVHEAAVAVPAGRASGASAPRSPA